MVLIFVIRCAFILHIGHLFFFKYGSNIHTRKTELVFTGILNEAQGITKKINKMCFYPDITDIF